ncbi:MAG TPA: hypothetical protein VIC06_03880 [Solirubrobacteraceae bacterium]
MTAGRLVLGLALLLVLAVLVLDMSGSAPRGTGSDHVSPVSFAATVPGGGNVCQPIVPLPVDAARAQLLIGTYGRPVPALGLSFGGPSGTVATGSLAAGGKEGPIIIPIHRVASGEANSFCLHVGGHSTVVFGGEGSPIAAATELVNGKQQGGRVSVLYLRSGNESWWQLLPSLDHRFGLGKAYVFGDWTLPVLALMLLGVWIAAIRLLLHELRREARA